MARRTAVLVVTLLLAPLATADAQTAPAASGAPIPAPGVAATPTAPGASAPAPGNPSNPGDFSRNPHPEMPWFGPATPYGQFLRWVWVPPRAVAVGDRVVEEPGTLNQRGRLSRAASSTWPIRSMSNGLKT